MRHWTESEVNHNNTHGMCVCVRVGVKSRAHPIHYFLPTAGMLFQEQLYSRGRVVITAGSGLLLSQASWLVVVPGIEFTIELLLSLPVPLQCTFGDSVAAFRSYSVGIG